MYIIIQNTSTFDVNKWPEMYYVETRDRPPTKKQQKRYIIQGDKNITGKRLWGGKGYKVPEGHRDIWRNKKIINS